MKKIILITLFFISISYLNSQESKFIFNKGYLEKGVYTILKVGEYANYDYLRIDENSIARYNLPLFKVTKDKHFLSFTTLNNHILSVFHPGAGRSAPSIVAINKDKLPFSSSKNIKWSDPRMSDALLFDVSPLLEKYFYLRKYDKIIASDFAYKQNESIYLTTLNRRILKIWEYDDKLYFFGKEKFEGMKDKAKLIYSMEGFIAQKIITFVLNNQLYLAADDGNIYTYKNEKLEITSKLPLPYEDILFIVDRDKDRLLCITKEEFEKADKMSDLDFVEIELD